MLHCVTLSSWPTFDGRWPDVFMPPHIHICGLFHKVSPQHLTCCSSLRCCNVTMFCRNIDTFCRIQEVTVCAENVHPELGCMLEDECLTARCTDWVCSVHQVMSALQSKLEMWANAQRDGRPAEHRWRPLFNAAVWLTPTTRLPCSNAAKTRNPLKLPGVPPN